MNTVPKPRRLTKRDQALDRLWSLVFEQLPHLDTCPVADRSGKRCNCGVRELQHEFMQKFPRRNIYTGELP